MHCFKVRTKTTQQYDHFSEAFSKPIHITQFECGQSVARGLYRCQRLCSHKQNMYTNSQYEHVNIETRDLSKEYLIQKKIEGEIAEQIKLGKKSMIFFLFEIKYLQPKWVNFELGTFFICFFFHYIFSTKWRLGYPNVKQRLTVTQKKHKHCISQQTKTQKNIKFIILFKSDFKQSFLSCIF